ncbi:MAG: hypothetical protein SNJ78_06465 [Spirochaetales bacterium]
MDPTYLKTFTAFLSNPAFQQVNTAPLTFIGGIVGGENPSRYSQSPLLWNRFFQLQKIPACFDALDLPSASQFPSFVNYMLKPPLCIDLTVTSPYKGVAYTSLSNLQVPISCSERVHHLQSLNHFILAPDKASYLADSTDGEGMIRALKKRTSLSGARVLLIGAGGAAASIGYEALREGAFLKIVNIIEQDARKLAHRFTEVLPTREIPCGGWETLLAWAKESDVIISAITESTPLSSEELTQVPEATLLADTRYGNRALFVQTAQSIGRSCIDGREMLFGQFYAAALQVAQTLELPKEQVELTLRQVEAEFQQPLPPGSGE